MRSGRAHREWRIFLWLSVVCAAISAWFGYQIRDATPSAAFLGAFTSLIIATPLLLFELKGQRLRLVRRLRRQPLLIYFGFRVLLYIVVIICGLLIVRLLADDTKVFDETFRASIVFSIVMSVFANLAFEVGGLLGFGTLKNLVTGRYARPRREQRAFVLIDMKDSTGLAERLGAIRFHEPLNAFFRDVTDAALECGAEIHKYVGDEAILTWSRRDAIAGGDCLSCPFLTRDLIAANSERYRARFGAVPQFRAALHWGEIVAGEIGDVRREIAYVGDTLNVAARLLEATKTLGEDVLASMDLLNQVTLPPDLKAKPTSTLTLRGRVAPLATAALERR